MQNIFFSPSSDKDVAIIFRSFSAKNGLIYEHKLSPDDLVVQTDAHQTLQRTRTSRAAEFYVMCE